MTTENSAPVNMGQLKFVTSQARAYLNMVLAPVGAGAEIEALFPMDNTENYAPANVGQLKYIASLFYDQLDAVTFDVRPGLVANGLPEAHLDAQALTSPGSPLYPWDTSAPASENFAPINIGQLKMVFSFDLDEWAALDADENGNPDWLDALGIGGSTGPFLDSDGDGVADVAELAAGTDPASPYDDAKGLSPGAGTGILILTPLP